MAHKQGDDSHTTGLLDGLKQLGPSLDKHGRAVDRLATAIEQTPGAVARETNAVRYAFDAGLVTGGITVAIVCLVLLLLTRR